MPLWVLDELRVGDGHEHRHADEDGDSQLVNAKLILLLANQIGDADVLREAMALARQGVTPPVHPAAEVAQ